jgi:hypothetical protein
MSKENEPVGYFLLRTTVNFIPQVAVFLWQAALVGAKVT